MFGKTKGGEKGRERGEERGEEREEEKFFPFSCLVCNEEMKGNTPY